MDTLPLWDTQSRDYIVRAAAGIEDKTLGDHATRRHPGLRGNRGGQGTWEDEDEDPLAVHGPWMLLYWT